MINDFAECVLCASTARELLFRLDMGRVVRCKGCGLISMVSISGSRLIRCDYDRTYFYPHPSKKVGYPDYFGAERPLRTEVGACFASAILNRFPYVKTSLDIGCGGGYLVHALRRHGIAAWGVDPAREVLEGADPDIRARLFHGTLDAPQVIDQAPYHLVTVMDVIEHIPDVVEFLAVAWSLVSDDGLLLLLTPRYGGHLAQAQQQAYVHFNIDHVYYFTETTLRRSVVHATGIDPTISDVLTFWRSAKACIPPAVAAKYTSERDSMVALVRHGPS